MVQIYTLQTNVLHYLSTSVAVLSVLINREPMFIPAITLMRALTDWTDKEIYDEIMKGQEESNHLQG